MNENNNVLSAARPWSITVTVFFCFLAGMLCVNNAYAANADAEMKDVLVEIKGEKIYVSSLLSGAFTPEIKETLASGAPVTFTYILQLKRKRRAIWNKTEREIAIKRTVMFDALTKEYLTWWKSAEGEDDIDFENEIEKAQVKRGKEKAQDSKADTNKVEDKKTEEPVLDPLMIKKGQDLEQWMTKLENIEIGVVDGLKVNATYYARIRAEIKSLKLIPPFNYILFFLSFWDFDTDWSESKPFSLSDGGSEVDRKEVESKDGNED